MLKKVHLPMSSSNISKIVRGKKTTTVRSDYMASQIGLEPGESGMITFGQRNFKVTNLGQKTIKEMGGKDKMWESEGFGEEGPMYNMTERWMEGSGRLNVYKIEPIFSEDKKKIQKDIKYIKARKGLE